MRFMLCVLATTLVSFANQASAQQTTEDVSNSPLFGLLDSNRDGTLDPYEAMDVLLLVESELEGENLSAKRLAEILNDIDDDDQAEIEEILSQMDTNNDGKTTIEELDDEMAEFAEMIDQNKDGVITAAEGAQFNMEEQMIPGPEAIQAKIDDIFEALDKNKDGKLVEDESQDEEQWHEISHGDSNNNGEVTKAELTKLFTSDNQKAEFKIVGNTAVMNGVICADTPAKVLRLIHEHPSVRTIEMENVPGSIDDEANLRAAGYVRKFGLATVLKADGSVASGGTDFFLAGKTRSYEPGAEFGIHSWGGPGYQGKDVPRDDPQHQLYLEYYEEMGIPATFYWRTLEAAPANDIHIMTEKELATFKFQTKKNDKLP